MNDKQLDTKCLIILISALFLTSCQYKRDETIISDVDGNHYETVMIGNQVWMSQNLKTTRYDDGTGIPCVLDQEEWLHLNHDAYCYYQNNEHKADTFGFLYNWYAVSTEKLCPAGWRIPADTDWMYLEGFVDSLYRTGDTIWNKLGLRGYDAGKRLKTINGWRPGNPGTDDFGFSAQPGGERLSRYYAGGSSGFWWTSTEASRSSAYYRNLIYSFEQIARDTHPKRMGFSIRCIKDAK